MVTILFSFDERYPQQLSRMWHCIISCGHHAMGFLGGAFSNTRDMGDVSLIPVLGRCPGRGNSIVFLPGRFHRQRTWWAVVLGVAKSQTWLSDWSDLIPSVYQFRGLDVRAEMLSHTDVSLYGHGTWSLVVTRLEISQIISLINIQRWLYTVLKAYVCN